MTTDIAITVYGKPYQTIAMLMSLRKHSGEHMGRIYMTIDKDAPWGDDMTPLWDYIHTNGINYHVPSEHVACRHSPSPREDVLYQYGIDNATTDYVLILHNDMMLTGNIVADMMSQIGDSVGIGAIGQCWNCFAHNAGLCDGSRWETFNPTRKETLQMMKDFPGARMNEKYISNPPMPLPECRLNEFVCLINRHILVNQSDNGLFFGLYNDIELGCRWFREMVLMGYKFRNYDITKMSNHRFWYNDSGYRVEWDRDKYFTAEKKAKEYTKL